MPQPISRRDFVRLAGLGGGAAVLGGGSVLSGSGAGPIGALGVPQAAGMGTGVAAADLAARVLVVLELAGGNDGFSMAPPVEADHLRSMRPTSAHGPADQLNGDGDVVLHPGFGRLRHRPLLLVDGVGSPAPDLSHFEMLRRMWAGDPDGTQATPTGFLGRLCDQLDTGAPVTGLTIGAASSPALIAERAGTIGLPELWCLEWLSDDDWWAETYRDTLAQMTSRDAGDTEALALARRGIAGGLGLGDLVTRLPVVEGYPETSLGTNLSLASQVIDGDVGVRVIQVSVDGDFDTHENHLERHDELMNELDQALDVFLADVAGRGHGERVLVATTSEFGRRPEENGDAGLDHGTASTMLLAGPVRSGRLGEQPSFTDLDDDGNVTATMSMNDYYATLAESWFGVPAASVLPGSPRPLADVW